MPSKPKKAAKPQKTPKADEFLDDDYVDEEQDLASRLAMDPLINVTALKDEESDRLQDEQVERTIAHRDRALWETAEPDSQTEARFYANLRQKILRGISREKINAMTIRDRVTAGKQLFEMQQLLLDKPTANINFEMRQEAPKVLDAVKAELARRERERQTIDVTPGES